MPTLTMRPSLYGGESLDIEENTTLDGYTVQDEQHRPYATITAYGGEWIVRKDGKEVGDPCESPEAALEALQREYDLRSCPLDPA